MSETKSVKKNILRDALIVLCSFFLGFLTALFPVLAAAEIILLAVLFAGHRRGLSVVCLAVSFLALALSGSLVLAVILLVLYLLSVGTLAVRFAKFKKDAHFNGIIAVCLAIAVTFGLVYGGLYLILGAEPITALCTGTEELLAASENGSADEMLRTLWMVRQTFNATQNETFNMLTALETAQKATELTHAELVKGTAGMMEFLLRSYLPGLLVLSVAVGGLLIYAFSDAILAAPEKGLGRVLALSGEAQRPLPKFDRWEVPRDIGTCLFLALGLFLIGSLAGLAFCDMPMTLIYTLFNAVFAIQGISFLYFLTGKWKWQKAGRVFFTVGISILLTFFGALAVVGVVDHLAHLRFLMSLKGSIQVKMGNISDLQNELKKQMEQQETSDDAPLPREVEPEDEGSGENDNTDN